MLNGFGLGGGYLAEMDQVVTNHFHFFGVIFFCWSGRFNTEDVMSACGWIS